MRDINSIATHPQDSRVAVVEYDEELIAAAQSSRFKAAAVKGRTNSPQLASFLDSLSQQDISGLCPIHGRITVRDNQIELTPRFSSITENDLPEIMTSRVADLGLLFSKASQTNRIAFIVSSIRTPESFLKKTWLGKYLKNEGMHPHHTPHMTWTVIGKGSEWEKDNEIYGVGENELLYIKPDFMHRSAAANKTDRRMICLFYPENNY